MMTVEVKGGWSLVVCCPH